MLRNNFLGLLCRFCRKIWKCHGGGGKFASHKFVSGKACEAVRAGCNKLNMTLNFNEMVAIYHLAIDMSMADGRLNENESAFMSSQLIRFGVTDTKEAEKIIKAAMALEPARAIVTAAAMSDEKKKYACSVLGALIAADGDVDENETALWGLMTVLCGFPKMTIAEAIVNVL